MKQLREDVKSFNDYLLFLKDAIHNLTEYWQVIGKPHPYIQDIQDGLHHADPFIVHKASIAATLLLEDKHIYH